MERQVITISLKPHLADFLRHEFEVDKHDRILIQRNHVIGRHITSLVKSSQFPLAKTEITNPVSILVPNTRMTDISCKFLYIDKWGEERISDFIKTQFDFRATEFFYKGYHVFHLQQKQIIEAFLDAYNIKECKVSFDAVKQNDFRKRKRTRSEIALELKRAVIE